MKKEYIFLKNFWFLQVRFLFDSFGVSLHSFLSTHPRKPSERNSLKRRNELRRRDPGERTSLVIPSLHSSDELLPGQGLAIGDHDHCPLLYGLQFPPSEADPSLYHIAGRSTVLTTPRPSPRPFSGHLATVSSPDLPRPTFPVSSSLRSGPAPTTITPRPSPRPPACHLDIVSSRGQPSLSPPPRGQDRPL